MSERPNPQAGEWVAFHRGAEDRLLGLARIEAGRCPACGGGLEVVDGWARCSCPSQSEDGPVEFQLRRPGLFVYRRVKS